MVIYVVAFSPSLLVDEAEYIAEIVVDIVTSCAHMRMGSIKKSKCLCVGGFCLTGFVMAHGPTGLRGYCSARLM